MKPMTDILQGANEPVRVFRNQIKADWRVAGWHPQDKENLNKIAWSRLRPGLKSKINPLTPNKGKFNSMQGVSTEMPIQRSSRTAYCPNSSSHLSSKCSPENHVNKWARNATSGYVYLSRQKYWNPSNQSRTRMINPLPCPGSRQRFMKLGSWKENAHTVGHLEVKHSGAQSILALTSPNTLLRQETEKISNFSTSSIFNKQRTILPYSV